MMRPFLEEQRIYAMHIAALFVPGVEVPTFSAHQVEVGPLTDWEQDDLKIMVDEGRRQLDRQMADLSGIRTRAQWLFTVASAGLVALGSAFISHRPTDIWLIGWGIGVCLVLYGTAGAASVLTVRADFETIDTAALSRYVPPILGHVATDYSEMLKRGENTIATWLTVFREAVTLVLIGGYVGLLAVVASHS